MGKECCIWLSRTTKTEGLGHCLVCFAANILTTVVMSPDYTRLRRVPVSHYRTQKGKMLPFPSRLQEPACGLGSANKTSDPCPKDTGTNKTVVMVVAQDLMVLVTVSVTAPWKWGQGVRRGGTKNAS